MKEKKARIEDALHATRAAVEEGVLPGGGVALIRSVAAIDSLKLSGDKATGAQIVAKALTRPTYQIAANAGQEGNVVARKVAAGKGNFGFNALKLEYGNLVSDGVLTPTKVE